MRQLVSTPGPRVKTRAIIMNNDQQEASLTQEPHLGLPGGSVFTHITERFLNHAHKLQFHFDAQVYGLHLRVNFERNHKVAHPVALVNVITQADCQPHPTLAEDGSEAARARLFYADASGSLGGSTGARVLGELAAQVRAAPVWQFDMETVAVAHATVAT